MKPVCIVSCPIDTFSGYGHRSRDFVRSLIEAKNDEWEIKILPQVWGSTPWGFLDKNDPLKSHYVQGTVTTQPDIWIQITIPNEFQKQGKFNIGVTAGIESTCPPPDFIEGMNRMDLNLVSSEFTKNIFENVQLTQNDNQGQPIKQFRLEKPIEVLFEGLDTGVYFKEPSKSGMLDNIDENFCFLFTGHWLPGKFGEDRKNVATLIETFLTTFNKKGPKPALLLKTNKVDYSLLDKEEILASIRKIRNKFGYKENLPNIYLLHGEFTNEELNKINNDPKVKSFLSFTKGEGFGRPLLEQAITGKPVVVPNWSGHTDFLNPQYVPLIPGFLENVHPSAANDWLIKEGKWFKPNESNVKSILKDVFKKYKSFIPKAKQQKQYAKTNFSWEKMKELVGNILEHNVPNLPQQVELKLPKLSLPKLKKIE